jgi:hypothetical protein
MLAATRRRSVAFMAARLQSAARFCKTVLHCFPVLEASDSRLGSHLFT